MATLTAPITVGTASANAAHAADLGKLVFVDGKMYRLCKASGAIATAAKKVLTSAVSAGAPTWLVSIDTTAANAYKCKFRVVVPAGQTGTGSTTTTLADGDYFLAQVSGPSQALCAAALAAGGSHVLVVNTLGQLKAATLTTLITAKAGVGFATHTANTTIAGATIGVQLQGLV